MCGNIRPWNDQEYERQFHRIELQNVECKKIHWKMMPNDNPVLHPTEIDVSKSIVNSKNEKQTQNITKPSNSSIINGSFYSFCVCAFAHQFLFCFESYFNWIVIEFYFTTAIFHTHSLHQAHILFLSRSSNTHKNTIEIGLRSISLSDSFEFSSHISFVCWKIGIDFIVLHFHLMVTFLFLRASFASVARFPLNKCKN